ncbi:DUF3995 domain-containing protein [Paenibacillus sp. Soil522]|uniref:DUF3995 domain-containing protein n=1 Tax=Paenibacillus sp. Soil522 TaxID=1736388 RepID=UPI0006F749E9|nr:DUF3995 domain-containing protein [Paenibacillus sp. Soil522]KRE35148.1 hypothetical protein ASG81_21420 [Paenibacillus sp. Soil522]
MQVVLAAIVGLVLFLVGCIHVYWLLGGRGGLAIAVPTRSNTKQPFFKPRRPEIAAVILIFWGVAALLLMFADIIPTIGPSWLPAFTGWALAVIFLLRAVGEFRAIGLFKIIRNTPFGRMDTIFYSPLCLVLCGLTTWMMVIA